MSKIYKKTAIIIIMLLCLGIVGCSESVTSENKDDSSTGEKNYTEISIRKGQRLEDYLSLELTFQYSSSKGRYDKATASIVGIRNYEYIDAQIEVYFVGLLYGGIFSINSSGTGQKTLDCTVNNTTLVQQGKSIKAAKNFTIRIPKWVFMNNEKHELIKINGFIFGAITIMHLIALFSMPYGYYTFLRWVTFIASIAVITITYKISQIENDEPINFITVIYFVIGLLWNPIFPIYQSSDVWKFLNFLVVAFSGFLAYSSYKLLN